MIKNLLRLQWVGLLILGSSLSAQIMNRPHQDFVRQALVNTEQGKILLQEDLNFELTDFYSSKNSGLQHIYVRQTFNGLEIMGTESSIHIGKSGTISSVKSKFVNSTAKRGFKSDPNPRITAVQAVQSAANHLGYTLSQSLQIINQDFSLDRKMKLSPAGISKSEIPARLMYFLQEDGNLVLVWDLSIEASQKDEWYSVQINAENGQIVNKVSWKNECNFGHAHEHHDGEMVHFHHPQSSVKAKISEKPTNMLLGAAYNVFPLPLESPYYGNRELIFEDDVVNSNASPFGWHDTDGVVGNEYTTTRGNNVNAYEDGNNPGFQPNPGNSMMFDYPFDQNYSYSNQYESAAITNLFYWNNIIHDIFYEYGFTELGGNFQQNNYGKGGVGNDYVRAEAQDGESTCNANFYTPPDGQLPRMQMFICQNKDGDYDNLVIMHEYGHGISNRLTGGPSNTSCLQNSEQMGEGWSDWFGLMVTMKEGDQGETPRAIGTYLFNQGPNGNGIRTHRYSTNMSINPHTYNSIKTESIPHGVGSVWAAMLWDLTWALIDEYGFDSDIYNGTGGNNIAMNLVMTGLKLQPCSPGFVDGRDAILEADQLLYNGANQCLIWDVFARRGLGVSATQGSSSSAQDGQQAFDTPSGVASFTAPGSVCASAEPFIAGGGSPMGGTYSGPGVTDNGNGTYTFNPEVAGVGVHTITYSITASDCAEASSASDTIEVTAALAIECQEDILVNTSNNSCSAVVTYELPQGLDGCPAGNSENFDGVSAPNLPNGWTTQTNSGSNNNWRTVSNQSYSSPNSVFAANLSSVSLSSLTSPEYEIASNSAKLKFRLNYNVESGYDGVVLEYSTNGTSWLDITNIGTFVSGGYTTQLSTGWGNPIQGRNAWSGNSNGFIAVEINLNSSLNGQDVQFRWRMGSDSMSSSVGVWLDNVEVEGVYSPQPTTTQIAGLPSGSEFPVGTTTNTFKVEDGNGNTAICSFNVIVNDGVGPNITCPDNATVVVAQGETFSLPDYWANGQVTAVDNCSDVSNKTQSPAVGTNLGVGTHTISFTVEDAAGNQSTCSFELVVTETMAVGDFNFSDLISLYPNPASDLVIISNKSQETIQKIIILDGSGKRVQEVKLANKNAENSISVKHLPTGTYVIQIVGDDKTITKKLIKK